MRMCFPLRGQGDEIGLDLHQVARAQPAQDALHLGGRPAEMAVERGDGQFVAFGGAYSIVVQREIGDV